MNEVVKLAIIRPSKIVDYIKSINKRLPHLIILYVDSFEKAVNAISDNSHLVFSVVTPDYYFDSVNDRATNLASIVKLINQNNQIFSYSKERPINVNSLDLVMTDYKTEEQEIDVLVDLLK